MHMQRHSEGVLDPAPEIMPTARNILERHILSAIVMFAKRDVTCALKQT